MSVWPYKHAQISRRKGANAGIQCPASLLADRSSQRDNNERVIQQGDTDIRQEYSALLLSMASGRRLLMRSAAMPMVCLFLRIRRLPLSLLWRIMRRALLCCRGVCTG